MENIKIYIELNLNVTNVLKYPYSTNPKYSSATELDLINAMM